LGTGARIGRGRRQKVSDKKVRLAINDCDLSTIKDHYSEYELEKENALLRSAARKLRKDISALALVRPRRLRLN
jgi:hypothetical protein